MKYIKRTVEHFEEIVGSALLVAMCAIAVLQAGSRFLSRLTPAVKPVYWTEEACTLLFIWLCFVGASYALKTGDHFAVDIIRRQLPRKAGRLLHVLGLVGVVCFSGLLVWYGGYLAARSVHVVTPSLEIPRSVAYAAVPVGGFLMLVRSIEMLVRRRDEAPRPAGPDMTEEGTAE